MLKIRTPNLDKLAQDFADRIISYVRKRYIYRSKRFSKNRKELELKIRGIYCAPVYDLKKSSSEFSTYLSNKKYDSNIEYIKSVYFDYDRIRKQKSELFRWLIRNVNVGVCPYCNRNFVQTHHAAQLDHFYPKSGATGTYSYLALSFYNLIPCCYQCNHEKADKKININPYEKGFSQGSKFKIENIQDLLLGELLNDKNKKDWKIELSLQPDEVNNEKVFHLKEVYSQHKDIVEELVQKAYSYKGGYYDGLIQTFAEMGIRSKEIQTLIFGTPIQEEDLGKRPLSKLTKDILDQIEIY